MKKVYIAHPLRGTKPYSAEQCEKNMKRVTYLCRLISALDDIVPFSPLHAFGYLDALKFDQEKAMKHCFALLESCDEMWLFGDWRSSEGCWLEIAHAHEAGIPVKEKLDLETPLIIMESLDKADGLECVLE